MNKLPSITSPLHSKFKNLNPKKLQINTYQSELDNVTMNLRNISPINGFAGRGANDNESTFYGYSILNHHHNLKNPKSPPRQSKYNKLVPKIQGISQIQRDISQLPSFYFQLSTAQDEKRQDSSNDAIIIENSKAVSSYKGIPPKPSKKTANFENYEFAKDYRNSHKNKPKDIYMSNSILRSNEKNVAKAAECIFKDLKKQEIAQDLGTKQRYYVTHEEMYKKFNFNNNNEKVEQKFKLKRDKVSHELAQRDNSKKQFVEKFMRKLKNLDNPFINQLMGDKIQECNSPHLQDDLKGHKASKPKKSEYKKENKVKKSLIQVKDTLDNLDKKSNKIQDFLNMHKANTTPHSDCEDTSHTNRYKINEPFIIDNMSLDGLLQQTSLMQSHHQILSPFTKGGNNALDVHPQRQMIQQQQQQQKGSKMSLLFRPQSNNDMSIILSEDVSF